METKKVEFFAWETVGVGIINATPLIVWDVPDDLTDEEYMELERIIEEINRAAESQDK